MGIGQALSDSVDIIDAESGATVREDVPAYVYLFTSIMADLGDESRPNRLLEETRVILGPDISIDRAADKIRWRGKLFTPDSDPVWSRQNGRDHHQTLAIKRLEG